MHGTFRRRTLHQPFSAVFYPRCEQASLRLHQQSEGEIRRFARRTRVNFPTPFPMPLRSPRMVSSKDIEGKILSDISNLFVKCFLRLIIRKQLLFSLIENLMKPEIE